MEDEWLDLVDDNDVVTGRMLRSEIIARGLSGFRVINAFLRNSRGEVWIPLRGPNKRQFPNCLDVSVGGHVAAGEDYDTAFVRELEEELRLVAGKVKWRRIARLTPARHGVSAFMWVYEVETDDTPAFNPDDFVSGRWLAPAVLLAELVSGVPQKGDLLLLVRHCYGEIGGPKGPEPTRYGDWEQKGRCTDF
jgi:8-oxo-dGTP pyrophosphatase MutT (NUDIX family)